MLASFTVLPRNWRPHAANAKLADANAKLGEVRDKVAALNAQLARLEASYGAAVADKDATVAQAEACQRRLGLANRLISALASGGSQHYSMAWRGGGARKNTAFEVPQLLMAGSGMKASTHINRC